MSDHGMNGTTIPTAPPVAETLRPLRDMAVEVLILRDLARRFGALVDIDKESALRLLLEFTGEAPTNETLARFVDALEEIRSRRKS